MELKKKYRWVLSGFIIMLILNLVTISSIWWVKNNHSDRDRDGDKNRTRSVERFHRYMKEKLDLTEIQLAEFKSLSAQHRAELDSVKREYHNTRKAYFSYLKPGTADEMKPVQKDSLEQELGRQYLLIETTVNEHISEIRELLEQEQFEEFSKMAYRKLLRDGDR